MALCEARGLKNRPREMGSCRDWVKRCRGGWNTEPPLHAGVVRFVLSAHVDAAVQKVKTFVEAR
jgi:hypothetical protein